MTNVECRKNVEIRMTKKRRNSGPGFGIRHLDFFRISSFVICQFNTDFAWQICSPAVPTECSLKNDGHVRLLVTTDKCLGTP